MAVRFESGWVRFGLPGLALGLFLASGWGLSGEKAAAQAPGSPARPVTGGVGKGRSAPSASAASTKGVTSGESGGILALIADLGLGLADPVALRDRHEEAGLRDLPSRSDQSARERQARGIAAVSMGPGSGPVQQPRARTRRREGAGGSRDSFQSVAGRTSGVTGRGLPTQTSDDQRLLEGRSRPRGACPWLSFTRSKKPPASLA